MLRPTHQTRSSAQPVAGPNSDARATASLQARVDAALSRPDAASRLAEVADLSESLARTDPASFARLSTEMLRWPTALVDSVVADLRSGFEADERCAAGPGSLHRSLHFLELWVEALRVAYADEHAFAQERERARLAVRYLRGEALGRCHGRAVGA